MADIALLYFLVYNGIDLFRIVRKGNHPYLIVDPYSLHSPFLTDGRNNIGEIFSVVFQHTVAGGAFNQIAGMNRTVDHAFIEMASIRGHVEIHDSRKGYNQQDEEKEVELKTQAPRGRQNFPEE
jgi:hypothetical protein